jgi:hypothetical protein
MGQVQTMMGKDASNIRWLPCVGITLNDQVPGNGWIVVCYDDGFDPSVSKVLEVSADDWVDAVVPKDQWGDRHSYLFLSVIIDPDDMPEI